MSDILLKREARVMIKTANRARDKYLRKMARRYEVSEKNVIHELAKIAFSDVSDIGRVARIDGQYRFIFKDFVKVSPEAKRAMQHIKINRRTGETHITTHDKLGALEKLGRYLKLFSDKLEVTGKDGAPLVPVVNVSIGKAKQQ